MNVEISFQFYEHVFHAIKTFENLNLFEIPQFGVFSQNVAVRKSYVIGYQIGF